MARNFRYYGKKRGNRRTGSRTLGSAGEALFFTVFLLLGIAGFAALIAFFAVPEWRMKHEFVAHTCTVVNKRTEPSESHDGTPARPGVQIEYQVRGEVYRRWLYDVDHVDSGRQGDEQAVQERFAVGRQYPCWYDPTDPREVVLVRESRWWIWLVFVVPISFIVIGGGGVIYAALRWGKSAERRAAMLQQAQQRDLFNLNGSAGREFPGIPNGSDITNSPGTTLRFRLPIATSPGWILLGVLAACLLWNGIVSVFVAIAVTGHLEGHPDWFLTLFVIPFVLGGIALVVFFFRQLLVTTGIGPTQMEISDHPLHPGGRCRLFVSQSGRLTMNSFEVLLVCEEEAVYRQGTDTRTETREVYRRPIFRREGFEVRRGLPFEAQCELEVPAGAMHSFKADHNAVTWKVVVQGDIAGWPDYRRAFPVIVHPPNGKTA